MNHLDHQPGTAVAASAPTYDPLRDGELLRSSQAAALCFVDDKTIIRWATESPRGGVFDAATGTRFYLRCLRTAGGHRRFPRRWLEEFLKRAARTERFSGVDLIRMRAQRERDPGQ